jgi:uncharacterized repeat protein (TIGR03803 family)
VFKLAPDGVVTELHKFSGEDGNNPDSPLLVDKAGDLYGVTARGGRHCARNGCGTLFKIAEDGTFTSLYVFPAHVGKEPIGKLVADKAGNLYGATSGGGRYDSGTIFRLNPDGTLDVLYRFKRGDDGEGPQGIISIGRDFYGATYLGGNGCVVPGCGTIFKLTADGKESVIHSFGSGSDGKYPFANLVADAAGNLYGTTVSGGASGYGTIFKIAPDGTETVLYSFPEGVNGAANVDSPLTLDDNGNLYGETTNVVNCGTVFKLAPDGTRTVLHQFDCVNDGEYPHGGLIWDKKGRLYGVTQYYGPNGAGTVFRLTP